MLLALKPLYGTSMLDERIPAATTADISTFLVSNQALAETLELKEPALTDGNILQGPAVEEAPVHEFEEMPVFRPAR